jgi:hypothetical protein
MKKVMLCSLAALLIFACNKKQETKTETAAVAKTAPVIPDCEKEITCDKPVKAGETGIVLPAGTKLCFTTDELEIRVTLPDGFAFSTKAGVDKAAPVYATYRCDCSQQGSSCKVFYADGLGFGCLQSSCTGSCTGHFTYHGYTVDKVVYTGEKEKFFNDPGIQKELATIQCDASYCKESLYGINFYLVNNEKIFLPQAKCDCEGTLACKLKVVSIPFVPKIYFCEGTCNGCELTVN